MPPADEAHSRLTRQPLAVAGGLTASPGLLAHSCLEPREGRTACVSSVCGGALAAASLSPASWRCNRPLARARRALICLSIALRVPPFLMN